MATTVGMRLQSIRFLHLGQRLRNEDTPHELDMEEGDDIDVFMEQCGD